MRYQDLKLRDAARVAGIGLVLVGLTGAALANQDGVQHVFGHRAVGLIAGLGIMGVLTWGASLWYLFTTPAQNAQFIRKAAAKGEKAALGFDWTLLDASDPDYGKLTIVYLMDRLRRRNA